MTPAAVSGRPGWHRLRRPGLCDFTQVHFWFNQSGNNWSEEHTIRGTPYTVDTTAVQFADFYGTGTTCLVWSYDYGAMTGGTIKCSISAAPKNPTFWSK